MKLLTRFTSIFIIITLSILSAANAQQSQTLASPDGKLQAKIMIVNGELSYSVSLSGTLLMSDMPLSMKFDNGVIAGQNIKSVKMITKKQTQEIIPTVRVRTADYKIAFNELEVPQKDYSILFRVYDDAVAYRFVTRFKQKEVRVLDEQVSYNFVQNDAILFPEDTTFYTHQERKFIDTELSKIENGRFCSPPMLLTDKAVRMLITEVDLESYPGIYYQKSGNNSFNAIFPHYPLEFKKTSDRDLKVTKYADYMAATSGARSYPWRVALVTDDDRQILNSNTLYALAAESKIGDTNWIKTGKVAWDWWNDTNLTGVDFKAGVNTSTYKYYIDFASKNNLDYIILDEGWYNIKTGILDINPDLDMEELAAYGKQKNIGIILWATWLALEENMDEAFKCFDKWGIKGIKIDFMQRDDQVMVEWYYSTAKKAAEHKLLVDYHGAYTPRGLNRTYPNMITSEGVYGLEQNKWIDDLTPEHNVTLAFTRMAIGPMDYTPGAMRNSNQRDFRFSHSRPMSLGTRAHQLGMYVVYESPIQMLSDSPTAYEKEPQTMEFLRAVPSVWDETVALKAVVGDYIVIARRSGDVWYLGAMNDWTAREVEVPLDFLGEGDFQLKEWADGVNVSKNAEDLKILISKVSSNKRIKIKLGSGGGYAAIINRVSPN